MESTSELVGDTVTAYITFAADEVPEIQLTCEASSHAVKGSLKKTITIKTIAPLTTSTTTTSTTTISTSTTSTTSTTSSSPRSSPRRLTLYDRPVADMPAEDDELYDYSHFSYLNERFEENYKETLAYAEQYYDEEYDTVEQWGLETQVTDYNNAQNSDKIRDIKNILDSGSNSMKSFFQWVIIMVYTTTLV